MHCNICDKIMSDSEIQVAPDGKGYEPCAVCMDVILDAAYSDGFTKEGSIEEDPDVEYDSDSDVETLDEGVHRTIFSRIDYEAQDEDDSYE